MIYKRATSLQLKCAAIHKIPQLEIKIRGKQEKSNHRVQSHQLVELQNNTPEISSIAKHWLKFQNIYKNNSAMEERDPRRGR